MASEIGKRIDGIVRLGLADALKAEGFDRQARTFRRREADGSIAVIHIQSSKYNAGNRGTFTVNLGIYLPGLAAMEGTPAHEKPQEYQCHLRQRIGFLMPDQQDYWWRVEPGVSDAQVAESLQQAVLVHGLAWLAAQEQCKRARLGLEGRALAAASSALGFWRKIFKSK